MDESKLAQGLALNTVNGDRDRKAVDVVEVGAGTTGITGAMQIAHTAATFELPVAMMNCPANFMAHLESVRADGSLSHWVAKAPGGRTVEWDEALNAATKLGPPKYEFGSLPLPEVAIPGKKSRQG